ncbi:MAG: Thymidylate synthase ThyX [Candidatus Anoxychlamydiales bacterium]|nr:Thymidylate synthase ThyX [Candidatus Anoxychlamydiales bacterium]
MGTDMNFTKEELLVLQKYVSNTNSNVFVLRNLPEVIKGALFSRYSRSSLGLRKLLLKEFIQNEDLSINELTESHNSLENQILQIQKAQNFYDRILDGFGDDSIGELGGAHLALEKISILAAKAIEDCRVGGSPLEKSTRYIYFDKKVDGEYLYYKEPILMTSAFKNLYIETCNNLFDTYAKLIPPMTEKLSKEFPKEDNISDGAYRAALRAKVLDCLRGLLPASTLTNMGVFGNGRFFEGLIKKLTAHSFAEYNQIGKEALKELSKDIPSFVRRAEPNSKYQKAYQDFVQKTKDTLKTITDEHSKMIEEPQGPKIKLINYDVNSLSKVLGAILYEYGQGSLESYQEYSKSLSKAEIASIFEELSSFRDNRRHKSMRALENASFTFEFVQDFGIYRDLQRHRMLTQERQYLTCNLGYYTPKEVLGTDMEKEYEEAMKRAKKAYDLIASALPEEAQYIVPMGYNINWYFTLNLRALQWLTELRSSPAGHPSYRYVAQEMAKQVSSVFPEFENFFKFVDFDGYDLGRMSQEVKRVEKSKVRL